MDCSLGLKFFDYFLLHVWLHCCVSGGVPKVFIFPLKSINFGSPFLNERFSILKFRPALFNCPMHPWRNQAPNNSANQS